MRVCICIFTKVNNSGATNFEIDIHITAYNAPIKHVRQRSSLLGNDEILLLGQGQEEGNCCMQGFVPGEFRNEVSFVDRIVYDRSRRDSQRVSTET